jgi:hypothetical protein
VLREPRGCHGRDINKSQDTHLTTSIDVVDEALRLKSEPVPTDWSYRRCGCLSVGILEHRHEYIAIFEEV